MHRFMLLCLFGLAGTILGHTPALLAEEPKAKGPWKGELAGYLLVPHQRVDAKYNAGFSLYATAWPLVENYPGSRFQTGLFGTWMFAQNEGLPRKGHYSDIEGGLGWWRDTRFATETPKFIMGGVALNFSEWANGPGAGKGRDWNNPKGHYAVVQLSPWVLWPPDGLNLKQGTTGELFGYGYLPLPLTEPKDTTAGKEVPTGNHCWTLFFNTENFKGPVTFFAPYFWSKPTIENPNMAGIFLDSRPSEPNKALQMETQHIPAYLAEDAEGTSYARVAPTRFPGKPGADSPLVHRMTVYTKSALWDDVEKWLDGGPVSKGRIDPEASTVQTFPGNGGATWRIYANNTPREERVPVAWNSYANPVAVNDDTFGYRWDQSLVSKADSQQGELLSLPEYFRLEKNRQGREQWVVVDPKSVPPETGLADVEFPRAERGKIDPYVTPDEPDGSWKKPGPVAGPFQVTLGDGSVVTYSWYRFADQPALLNADMTDAERERLQKRVEKLHREWTKDRDYLPPPTIGKLAHLDPAVLVTPPKGMEVGYVPIVTRQAAKE